VWSQAQQGLFLADQHYHTQYTSRYQPVLQIFTLMHLCDVVARFFPDKVDSSSKDGSEAVQFIMKVLSQSHASYPITGIFEELLRKSVSQCSLRLSSDVNELLARSAKLGYKMDDFIDACTRPTYLQPVDEIHMNFSDSFIMDWVSEAPSLGFQERDIGASRLRITNSEEEKGAQSLMQIRNLLNTT